MIKRSRLQPYRTTIFLHSCGWLLPSIYLISARSKKKKKKNHISNSGGKIKATSLPKLLPCFVKKLQHVVLGELQVPNALQYRFKMLSGRTPRNADQNGVWFLLLICRSLEIKHSLNTLTAEPFFSRRNCFAADKLTRHEVPGTQCRWRV